MGIDKIPMTVTGEKQLREELHKLKVEERPKVIEAIATAREHGDLKENAEYHAAREQQSFVEGRIVDIENKLSLSHVVDPTKLSGEKIVFGATVKLLNINSDDEVSYKIVGDDEANFKLQKISVNTPIARALIGKKVGDEIKVTTPGGAVEYEILTVEFV